MSMPRNTTRPAVRREDAVDEIEERRFAGAVGADEAEDLALVDGEAQTVHRLHAAEALAQAVDLEERGHSSTFRSRGQRP